MPRYYCEKCSTPFVRDSQGARVHRFCSQECYHSWSRENKAYRGTFSKGNEPWNAGTKGVMKANSGSFTKGQKPLKYVSVGSTAIRRDKSGKQRAWIKIADNGNSYDWILRAVHVWQSQNGTIAKGKIIHHRDRDSLNDAIENLQALTRSEHLKEHKPEHEAKRSRAASAAATERHARNRAARKQDSATSAELL